MPGLIMDRRQRSSSDVIPCSRLTASAAASQERLRGRSALARDSWPRGNAAHRSPRDLASRTAVATRAAVASTLVHFAEITDAGDRSVLLPPRAAQRRRWDSPSTASAARSSPGSRVIITVVGISLPLLRHHAERFGICGRASGTRAASVGECARRRAEPGWCAAVLTSERADMLFDCEGVRKAAASERQPSASERAM